MPAQGDGEGHGSTVLMQEGDIIGDCWDEGWVYALISDGKSFYVGATTDPSGRLKQHQGNTQYPRRAGAKMLLLQGPFERVQRNPRYMDPISVAEREWAFRLDCPGETTVGSITVQHDVLENKDSWLLADRIDRRLYDRVPSWFGGGYGRAA